MEIDSTKIGSKHEVASETSIFRVLGNVPFKWAAGPTVGYIDYSNILQDMFNFTNFINVGK